MSKLDITKIDKNMDAVTKIDKSGFDFYNIDDEPFRIYGVYRDGEWYRRLPEALAEKVSRGVHILHTNTAGGRVRFITNSRRFAFIYKGDGGTPSDNGGYLNRSGFDLYADGEFVTTARCGNKFPVTYYEHIGNELVGERRDRVITVNFPNYGAVSELLIGLEEGSTLKRAPDYTYECPVVYYGSSITQGGCASRPGLSYQGVLSRWLDTNYINLGFSGNAKGEPIMAKYIAGLEMSAFVYDYDHNAPTAEHLAATHEPFFKIIREAHPDLPIIIMTRPKYSLDEDELRRAEIIKGTYKRALASGDKNVYYIFGHDLMEEIGSEGLVDGAHPNDLGFRYMALGIRPLLEKILGNK